MSKTYICFSLPSGMVVRAKFDVIVMDRIAMGDIKLPDTDPKLWEFQDMELSQSFTELSFFCEDSVPIVFKLSWSDLMKLKEIEAKLPKANTNGYYIKDAAIKYHNLIQHPECDCLIPF